MAIMALGKEWSEDPMTGLTDEDRRVIAEAMKIPGQVSERELAEMCRLAKEVPENGVVVEVGSLYGRSSYVWSKCVPFGARVYCIDPWQRVQWIIDWVEKPLKAEREFSLDAFLHYTGNAANIHPIQGSSPECVADWDIPIDLYFEDAIHEDPGFSRNADFWLQHLKPGGIFSGDDFRGNYYDITRYVTDKAQEWNSRLTVAGTLFWLCKP